MRMERCGMVRTGTEWQAEYGGGVLGGAGTDTDWQVWCGSEWYGRARCAAVWFVVVR